MNFLVEKLKSYAQNHMNVLLIGNHGVGKSYITKAIAEQMGLRFKYYSSPTLDPWCDIVGVPKPDEETQTLKFYRPEELLDAEFIMFDELNRAHPRVLNAVLEIIQFKAVNGRSLPNLKMIWAAINPPGEDYQVEDMDPALVDRFHVYIKIPAEINMEYMKTVMKEDTAKILKEWWVEDLDKAQKKVVSPRRIEYIGVLFDKGLPWKDSMPQGVELPVKSLSRKFKILHNKVDGIDITAELIMDEPGKVMELYNNDKRAGQAIASRMAKFEIEDIFDRRLLLECLNQEEIGRVAFNKMEFMQRGLLKCFKDENIDPATEYPKIYKAFNLEKFIK